MIKALVKFSFKIPDACQYEPDNCERICSTDCAALDLHEEIIETYHKLDIMHNLRAKYPDKEVHFHSWRVV